VVLRAVLLALSLSPSACAQEPPPEAPADPVAAAKQMLATAEEVAADVEELRGWKFKRPVEKDVRTEAQLREFLGRELEEQYAGGKLEREETWLKLLALLPPDMSLRDTTMEVLINQVGGFYDPEVGSFFMMAESSRFGDVVNRMLIAHELCHALDDQYVDLKALTEPEGKQLTTDEQFAIGGVVEGSATALMYAWIARATKDGELDLGQIREIERAEMERSKPLLEAPRWFSLIIANYLVGEYFVTRGKTIGEAVAEHDTGAGIAEAARDPPRSTEQILHPDKYWNDGERDEPVRIADDDAVAAELERMIGAAVVHRDTLGEMVCALVASPIDAKTRLELAVSPSYWTNTAAKGWGGDRLYLLAPANDDGTPDLARAEVLWITAWDTVEDREEFDRALVKRRGQQPGFASHAEGRVAVYRFGATREAAEIEKLPTLVRWEQDGKPWDPAGR
jgi:hypothetical protein